MSRNNCLDKVVIYTDGACSNNPGPGGWGAVLLYNSSMKDISGAEENTTNNRMELTAVIKALHALNTTEIPVVVYTDSTYVKQGITVWIHSWKRTKWKNGKIKNIDLWQELDKISSSFSIEWRWVKGHSGDALNERADKLARNAIRGV